MTRVFFDVGVSLDGFIAGPNRGPRNPLGDGGLSIHAWMFPQRNFRRLLGLGDDGETGDDNRLIGEIYGRIGANSWASGCSRRARPTGRRTRRSTPGLRPHARAKEPLAQGGRLELHHAPVLLGSCVRLLDAVERDRFSIEIDSAAHSPNVTHVRYAVRCK